MKRDDNMILIGEVAKNLGIHDQTIRMYERKHLIKPQRTTNGTRIFSKNDMTKITIIITLTQEVGMNLSGVKIVFALAKNYVCRMMNYWISFMITVWNFRLR